MVGTWRKQDKDRELQQEQEGLVQERKKWTGEEEEEGSEVESSYEGQRRRLQNKWEEPSRRHGPERVPERRQRERARKS